MCAVTMFCGGVSVREIDGDVLAVVWFKCGMATGPALTGVPLTVASG